MRCDFCERRFFRLRSELPDTAQEQLDYTLGLVATGHVPRDSGVQLTLMDHLIDAGAKPGGSVLAATVSIAFKACPDDTPGAGLP